MARPAHEGGASHHTELVRRAIRRMREHEESPALEELLQQSQGTWKRGDAVAYQQSLREEWQDGISPAMEYLPEVASRAAVSVIPRATRTADFVMAHILTSG